MGEAVEGAGVASNRGEAAVEGVAEDTTTDVVAEEVAMMTAVVVAAVAGMTTVGEADGADTMTDVAEAAVDTAEIENEEVK